MDLRELHFGIEIETVGVTRKCVATAIQSVVGGEKEHVGHPSAYDPWQVTDRNGRVWNVVSDSSLNDVHPDLRAEVVTPILSYQDIPELQEVVRAVCKAGGRSSDHCGIHVHVSGSAFDGRTLANLVKIVHKQEPLIHAALGVSQARLSRYTKPVSADLIAKIERFHPKTKEEFNKLWYGHYNASPQRYDTSRYSGVNLNSLFLRGSVEFRFFEGTLHAGKVRSYVQYALALIAKALNGRSASSKKRVLDPGAAKFQFRVHLLHLGMIGDEFKTARKHLLAALPGDSAFRNGRPQKAKKGAKPREDAGTVDAGQAPDTQTPTPQDVLVSGGADENTSTPNQVAQMA